jgi:two-component system, LytTR family, sensor kinase
MTMRRVWSLALAIATVLGLSSVAFVYFGMKAAGKPLSFGTAVLAGLPDWYFWAALTPLVFWLGQRFPLEQGRWVRAALVHLVAGAAVAVVELGAFTTFNHWFYYNPYAPAPAEFGEAYLKNVLRYFHYAFILYWFIVAAATASRYQRDSAARERDAAVLGLRNAQLESELTRAQLEALRAQLHPHFLFNALNAIAGLVRERRNEAATELIAGLGSLLRHALRTTERDEIPLREELDVLESYLGVERARFRDRLRVQFDIEPAALDREVPSLILQPLVENAIRHGLANTMEGGQIWISARTAPASLELEVRDNGRGVDGEVSASESSRVGLRNTRARLERLYGALGGLEVTNVLEGGAVARVRIPHR